MQKIGGSFQLTATDLVGYLNCRHLSELDRAVAEGRITKPKAFDPLLEILWERGAAHERNYVDHLMEAGLDVVRIDGIGLGEAAISETLAAMKKGAAVIVQGALAHQCWGGRADNPSADTLWVIARYRRTGRSNDEPLNVTSCGVSSAIRSTNDMINSFSTRSPT
jgi:hypothetical protein